MGACMVACVNGWMYFYVHFGMHGSGRLWAHKNALKLNVPIDTHNYAHAQCPHTLADVHAHACIIHTCAHALKGMAACMEV